MKPETRNCQNCKKEFVIEPEDFEFYDKIKVPPPTWCPECRYKRRMSWRNTWHLFKKKEALGGKEIFSFIPEESPYKIYDRDFWWSDGWDPMTYGRDYDWNKPFFQQFRELCHEVPAPAHSYRELTRCLYCTNGNSMKDCYLVRASTFTEDSSYLIWDRASKFCMEGHMTISCELCYGIVNCIKCYKTLFSVDCEDSQELVFCKDCVGCTECFGSSGLRNKSYVFFNEPCTKEEYKKRKQEYDLGSHETKTKMETRARELWLKKPVKYYHGRNNYGISGEYIDNSKNATHCYRVRDAEDVKYCGNILGGPFKDSYDYANWGEGAELMYESLVCGTGCSNVKFSWNIFPSSKNITYSTFCNSSSDLFGCVGLRKKQYCILNKQYTKEEYELLLPKIIQHMNDMPYRDALGREYRYGEFFPAEHSPIPYSASEVAEFYPLTDEDAKKQGFASFPVARNKYVHTMEAKKIPDNIKDASDTIVNESIECAHKGECTDECVGVYRITQAELDFCRRLSIPVPRVCFNCRHYARLKDRNRMQLHHRSCACDKMGHGHEGACNNEFETSYAPDRPEIVYCESCYQKEVV